MQMLPTEQFANIGSNNCNRIRGSRNKHWNGPGKDSNAAARITLSCFSKTMNSKFRGGVTILCGAVPMFVLGSSNRVTIVASDVFRFFEQNLHFMTKNIERKNWKLKLSPAISTPNFRSFSVYVFSARPGPRPRPDRCPGLPSPPGSACHVALLGPLFCLPRQPSWMLAWLLSQAHHT